MWNSDDSSYIERLFYEDSRDKKRTASGARHNSGRRGGGLHGIKQGIRMPSDVMKHNNKKAYKDYTKASECRVSNIYENLETIGSLADIIKNNSPAEVKVILTGLKRRHTNRALTKHFNISSGKLYSTYKKFGVEYEQRNSANYQRKVARDAEDEVALTIDRPQEEERTVEVVAPVVAQPVETPKETDTFEIKYYKANIEGKSIQDQVTNLISILSQVGKYEIRLSIRELEESSKDE